MATEQDKVDSGALATVVVVGVFATLSVALGVDALYRNESSRVSATRAGSASYAVHALVKEQRAALDAQPMPIERAMSAVVLDLQRNPWSATPPMPEKDAGTDAAAEEVADAGADAAAPTFDAMGNPIPADAPSPPAAPTTTAPATASPPAPAPTPASPAPTAAKPKAPTTPAVPTPAAPASPKPAAPTPAAPASPKPAAPTPATPPTPAAPTAAPAPAPPHG